MVGETSHATSSNLIFRSWGARFICQQLSKDGICKVGAMAHPSFMSESHVSVVEGKLRNAFVWNQNWNFLSSVVYCCTQYRFAIPTWRTHSNSRNFDRGREIIQYASVLESNPRLRGKALSIPFDMECVMYWFDKTRGNLTDPYEKWSKKHCFESFVSWLNYWLSQVWGSLSCCVCP